MMNTSAVDAMLREWNDKIGIPIADRPVVPEESIRRLRESSVRERCFEFQIASMSGDVLGVADALADLLYVVYGAALEWGIPLDAVFREVHRSNMSKVWPDGTVHYREDGKVLNPPTYSPARIAWVMSNPGENV